MNNMSVRLNAHTHTCYTRIRALSSTPLTHPELLLKKLLLLLLEDMLVQLMLQVLLQQ